MPIHLHPITRRDFLARSVAAGAAVVLGPTARGAQESGRVDPHRFALLADTHIDADPAKVSRGVNMTDHLARAVREVASLAPRPAGVIVGGDCAITKGLKGDYVQFASVAKGLSDAKLPVHLALGNHDHRENMYAALKARRPAKAPVAGKHVSIITAPRANWFLLDSLNVVNQVPGLLGAKQLAWLAKALDAHRDRPAIVVAHHDPQWTVEDPTGKKRRISGLVDTEALFEVMAKRRHVKAYVFGHTHRWGRSVRDGLHLINVPAVGYVFQKTQPSGWLLAQLKSDGVALELRSIDPEHKAHGQKVELTWRS
jgi:Icc protein